MALNLFDRLARSRSRLNGVAVGDIVGGCDAGRTLGADGDLSGRVVVVDEPDALSTLGMIATAWRRGAVPLLAGTSLHKFPWWKDAPGSFLVEPAALSDWSLPASCALIQATSGSSGTPRLAMRSHESFAWESRAYAEVWGGDNQPLVHCVKLEHSLGIGITLSALLEDRDVYHQPPIQANRLTGLGARIGVAAGTPSTLRVLHQVLAAQDVRVDSVFCGAGSLDSALWTALERRWGLPITLGFGSTETGGVLAGKSGIGLPVEGAVLEQAPVNGSNEPFQLKIRFGHEVLGYVERPHGSHVWEFPDLVRRGDDGQLGHVARISQTMRTREQTREIGRLADVLRTTGRDWRLLEPGEADQSCARLVLEGAPLTGAEEERIRTAAGSAFADTAIRTILRFPRNEIGKIELARLIATEPDSE